MFPSTSAPVLGLIIAQMHHRNHHAGDPAKGVRATEVENILAAWRSRPLHLSHVHRKRLGTLFATDFNEEVSETISNGIRRSGTYPDPDPYDMTVLTHSRTHACTHSRTHARTHVFTHPLTSTSSVDQSTMRRSGASCRARPCAVRMESMVRPACLSRLASLIYRTYRM